jgi:kumamolisin
MAVDPKMVALAGSERTPIPGAKAVGPVASDERFEVTVRLRPKSSLQALAASGALSDELPKKRKYLSREEYAKTHGADPADVAAVEGFAKAQHLTVVETNAARRSVVLSGTAADFSKAFGVSLQQFEHAHGSYRGRTGAIHIPESLAAIVEGVFGLDNRPQARPHYQLHPSAGGGVQTHAAAGSFTPLQLAKLYDFPTGVDGSGQCIAIIELGGGYRPADLQTYFSKLGVAAPTVKAILVDHAKNHPTNANGPDGEVMLDIEVAAAIAPKAVIAVYFAPNTSQGFLDAITTALHDTTNKPSVISISWGGPESTWTPQAMKQFDQAFQAAAALGVTVCVAAGDNGSGDGVGDGKPHVDFPASSPFALGCGGTKLTANASGIADEVVWNENANSATGGGVSSFFPLPGYQTAAHVPSGAGGGTGRGVPDVAGDADPATGYQVRVDGQDFVIGGTSAVAPLWAGLIALFNQKLGKPVGFLNPIIYGSLAGKGAFRSITNGNNGTFKAGPGWNACTGWGSPIGAKLLMGLSG